MFGLLAGFLASLGVYGLVSDSVAQRRREIGIRMALGAQRRSVVYLVTLGEMSSIILGGFLGLVLSVGLAHAYTYLLYGLRGVDFLSVAVAFVVLCLVSLTTSVVPTLRATQVPLANLLAD
jgi:ABC-type antimicrobial peptide transport system permease subunit